MLDLEQSKQRLAGAAVADVAECLGGARTDAPVRMLERTDEWLDAALVAYLAERTGRVALEAVPG